MKTIENINSYQFSQIFIIIKKTLDFPLEQYKRQATNQMVLQMVCVATHTPSNGEDLCVL